MAPTISPSPSFETPNKICEEPCANAIAEATEPRPIARFIGCTPKYLTHRLDKSMSPLVRIDITQVMNSDAILNNINVFGAIFSSDSFSVNLVIAVKPFRTKDENKNTGTNIKTKFEYKGSNAMGFSSSIVKFQLKLNAFVSCVLVVVEFWGKVAKPPQKRRGV